MRFRIWLAIPILLWAQESPDLYLEENEPQPPAPTEEKQSGAQTKLPKQAIDRFPIQDLKGLAFYDSVEKIGSLCRISGIEVALPVPDRNEFAQTMGCFLHKPFSFEEIGRLKQEVVRFYQQRGFPIVGVFVPKGQDTSCDTVGIVILVGKVGTVKAEGARYFSNEKIASQFRLKPGQEIRSAPIDADLQWINQNPFRTTSAVFEPGQHVGETDIMLTTKDRFPVRVYSGYENTGTPITGTPRFLAGFNCGNAFALGHRLDYLFVTETQPRNWFANIASYEIPLPWRNTFKMQGSYTLTRPPVDEVLGLEGRGWQISGRYSIPFATWLWDNTFSLGYEFKRTNNFLTFGVQTVFNNFIDVSQFVVGYEGSMHYGTGCSLTTGAAVYFSPGNMTAFNKTVYFQTERPGATSQYIYSKINIDHVFRFPKGCKWVLSGIFQASTANLLPSEEFPLGGFYTVRGYDEFETISDNGFLLRNEFYLQDFFIPPGKKQKLQLLGFLDFGVAIHDDRQVVDHFASTLASFGPGLRYQFENNIFIRADYGIQMSYITNLQTHATRTSRLHFGAQVAF